LTSSSNIHALGFTKKLNNYQNILDSFVLFISIFDVKLYLDHFDLRTRKFFGGIFKLENIVQDSSNVEASSRKQQKNV